MLHNSLTQEQWQKYSFFAQMANVGAEVGRSIRWRNRDAALSKSAIERGLELLDLTIADGRNKSHLKEICRTKEVLIDYFYYNNQYGSNDEKWESYFYGFNYAAAIRRGA